MGSGWNKKIKNIISNITKILCLACLGTTASISNDLLEILNLKPCNNITWKKRMPWLSRRTGMLMASSTQHAMFSRHLSSKTGRQESSLGESTITRDCTANVYRTQGLGAMRNQRGTETGQRWLQSRPDDPSAQQQINMSKVRKEAREGDTLRAEEITHIPHKDGMHAWHTVKWQRPDGASSRYLVRSHDYCWGKTQGTLETEARR